MPRNWQDRVQDAERHESYHLDAYEYAIRQMSRKRASRHVTYLWYTRAQAHLRHAEYWYQEIRKAQRNLGRQMQAYQEQLARDAAKRAKESDDELYAEWEFGFEYEAERDASSNVDMNFRVQRDDGGSFSFDTALNVMRHVRDHYGRAPKGYVVTAIDWRNPGKSWSSTDDGDFGVRDIRDGPLRAVIETAAKEADTWDGPRGKKMRVGAPKRV